LFVEYLTSVDSRFLLSQFGLPKLAFEAFRFENPSQFQWLSNSHVIRLRRFPLSATLLVGINDSEEAESLLRIV
jgi:hypothetical protein